MAKPRFTREIATLLEAKVAVKIEPDNNQHVVFADEALNYAITLDPRAAHQIGQAMVQAARIAAMNVLDPAPVTAS